MQKPCLYKLLRFEAGQYLIELAAVMAVSMGFVVGALDFSKAMHVYNSLQEGVNQALRCAITTDGCVDVAYSTRSPLYEVTTKNPQPRWPIYKRLYSGTARWFELDEAVMLPTVRTLNSGSYSLPGRYFSLNSPIYESEVDVRMYIRQAKGMYAYTGEIKSGATSGVSYSFKVDSVQFNRNGGYIPSENFPVGDVTRNSSYLSPVFRAPSYDLSLPCLDSSDLDKKNPSDSSGYVKSACDLGSGINMSYHITGSSNSQGRSKLKLELIEVGGDVIDQGGRVFSAGDASFVPRGLLGGNWSNAHDYEEFRLHRNLKVAPGGRYRIRITMTEADNSNSVWNGGRLKVFFPVIREELIHLKCISDGARNSSECKPQYFVRDKEGSLAIPTPDYAKSNFKRTDGIISYETTPVSCQVHDFNSVGTAAQYLRDRNRVGPSDSHLAYAVNSGCKNCSLTIDPDPKACLDQPEYRKAYQQSCPDNYGVNPNLKGTAWTVAAAGICPVTNPDSDPAYSIGDLQLKYTEKTQNLKNLTVNRIRTACDQSFEGPDNADWPAGLKPYQAVSWSMKELTNKKYEYYTGAVDPLKLKEVEPGKYGCFAVGEEYYGRNCDKSGDNAGCESVPKNLPDTSIMFGPQDADCTYKDLLAKDPTILADHDSGVSGKTVYVDAGDPEIANLGTPSWSYSAPPPGQECFALSPNYDHLADVPGDVLPGVYTADNLPAVCYDGTTQCSVKYVGMTEGEPTTVNTDNEKAEGIGLSLMAQVLPWGSPNCEEDNCYNLRMVEDDPKIALAQASMNVPLNILLGNTIQIRYSQSAPKEKYLVK